MKLKLDKSLSPQLKPLLANLGHDASTAREEGLQGKPDDEVAARARLERRMLLTLDTDLAT